MPRALLAPPRFLLGIIFYPLEQGLREVERHAVVPRVENVLFFDEEHTKGVLPTFAFTTSQGPSAGIHLFDHDLGGHKEKLDAQASFGGTYNQAYQLGFSADHLLGTPIWFETRLRYESDRHLFFAGYGDLPIRAHAGQTNLGPRQAAVETRFLENRVLQLGRLGVAVGKEGALLKIGATAIVNHRDFEHSTDTSDPSIETVYDTTKIPGFTDGARTVEIDGNVIVDLRDVPGPTSSGLYFEGFGGGVPRADSYGFGHYGHYGAEATGYINLYKKTRVLVFRLVHEGVVGNLDDIPFTDLARLGGPNRLRGFDLDRFRDKTSAVATIEYHYPIHANISGSLFIDAGHVGQDYETLMKFKDWHVGGGGGFILHSKKSNLLSVDIAYGESLQLYLTTDPLRAFSKRDTQL